MARNRVADLRHLVLGQSAERRYRGARVRCDRCANPGIIRLRETLEELFGRARMASDQTPRPGSAADERFERCGVERRIRHRDAEKVA